VIELREEHVVEVDERLDVPLAVQRQQYGQEKDQVACGQEEHAGQVDARRYGIATVRAAVAFVAAAALARAHQIQLTIYYIARAIITAIVIRALIARHLYDRIGHIALRTWH